MDIIVLDVKKSMGDKSGTMRILIASVFYLLSSAHQVVLPPLILTMEGATYTG